MEAAYEADLALRFLEAGLYRNAAGKAFQAFKALLAALAMKYRDALAQGSSATTLLGARKMAVTGFIAAFTTSFAHRRCFVSQLRDMPRYDNFLRFHSYALHN